MTPNKIKTVLKVILPVILIIYNYGFSNILLFMLSIKSLYYNIFILILILLVLFYTISSIVLYILFSKNNFKIPTNLPKYLTNWLIEIKVLSKTPVYNIIIRRLSFETYILTLALILFLIQMF